MHMCVHTHVCRDQGQTRCHSFSLFNYLFNWNRVSHWPGVHQKTRGLPTSPWYLLLFHSEAGITIIYLCAWLLKSVVLGITLRSSGLYGKHFTDWTTFSVQGSDMIWMNNEIFLTKSPYVNSFLCIPVGIQSPTPLSRGYMTESGDMFSVTVLLCDKSTTTLPIVSGPDPYKKTLGSPKCQQRSIERHRADVDLRKQEVHCCDDICLWWQRASCRLTKRLNFTVVISQLWNPFHYHQLGWDRK